MKRPSLTILLPTFNRAYYIAFSIKSIIQQDFKNYEILILDNGSTDNTQKIVHSFNDKRIKYIKNKKNIGYARNIYKGFTKASGKYIFMLSDDDVILRKDTFSTIYKWMEKKQAGYAQIGLMYYDLDFYKPSVLDHVATKRIYVPPSNDIIIKTIHWHYGFISGNIFRKDFINIKNDILKDDIWWTYLKAAYRAMIHHGGFYFGEHFIIARTSTTGLISYLDIKKNKEFYMNRLFEIYKEFDQSKQRLSKFLKNRLLIVISTFPGIKYYTSNSNVIHMAKQILKLYPKFRYSIYFWSHLVLSILLPKIILTAFRKIRTLKGAWMLRELCIEINLKENLDRILN